MGCNVSICDFPNYKPSSRSNETSSTRFVFTGSRTSRQPWNEEMHFDLDHYRWKLIKEPGWRKDLEAIMIKAQPTLEDVDLFRRFDLLWDFQKQIEQLPKVTNNRSEKSCATTRIRNGKEYHVVTEQSGFETRTDGHLRVNGGEINEESSAILETKVSIRSAASTMDSRKSANGWQHGYKLNRTN
ncbi:hypothetical protein GX48_07001 [Paracoccidioides brasiliensis]|nr:hypothetical protein GX48_07001 [Paracoccidioides brasiliensis]